MQAEHWASVITAVIGVVAITITVVCAFKRPRHETDWTLRVAVVSIVALVLSVVVPAIASAFA